MYLLEYSNILFALSLPHNNLFAIPYCHSFKNGLILVPNSQSMTRCENSHLHVLKKRGIKFRINLKALEETSMVGEQRNILRILCEFLFSVGLLGFPFQCYSFKYHFNAGLTVFSFVISRFLSCIRRNMKRRTPFYLVYFRNRKRYFQFYLRPH